MTDRSGPRGADRPARPEDVEAICAGLPGTELGISWGDRPTWKIGGKGFVIFRRARHDVVDPVTGQEWDDVLVVTTPGFAEKEALVADPDTPFFTVPHFDRSSSVLVRTSRLGELSRAELAEVLTEAWATRAPKRLVREHLGPDA